MSGGRGPFITIRRPAPTARNSQAAKKAFFQEFVNLQRAEDETLLAAPHRPRLIYIRDANLLNETMPHWYPQFIEAVRSRRPGPIPRPTSPVLNPTVVILGVSPSIITPRPASPSSEPGGLMSILMSRNSPHSRNASPPPRTPKGVEWDESPTAQKARERRLHDRLSKWGRHDASVFYSELPDLESAPSDTTSGRHPKSLMNLFVAIPEGGSGPPIISAPTTEDGLGRGERPNSHARLIE